jgi:hypothetical protein
MIKPRHETRNITINMNYYRILKENNIFNKVNFEEKDKKNIYDSFDSFLNMLLNNNKYDPHMWNQGEILDIVYKIPFNNLNEKVKHILFTETLTDDCEKLSKMYNLKKSQKCYIHKNVGFKHIKKIIYELIDNKTFINKIKNIIKDDIKNYNILLKKINKFDEISKKTKIWNTYTKLFNENILMETNKKVIIFGVGNNAEVAYYYLKNDTKDDVVAFALDKEYIKENTKFGLPVVDFSNLKDIYPPDKYYFFAPCSGTNLNRYRERIYNESKKMGYNLYTYISSKANVYTKDIGENCFILENCNIQP